MAFVGQYEVKEPTNKSWIARLWRRLHTRVETEHQRAELKKIGYI